MVPKWRRYLRFWRDDVEADVDDELRFHLDARREELRARGIPPDEIERTIAGEFGDVEATRRGLQEIGARMERRRERRAWWHRLRGDLAYALRGLRATPAFTAGVVLTLALGVGAATTMYGVMRRLLVQPPPHVLAPHEVGKLHFRYESPGDTVRTFDRLSYPFYERLAAGTRALADVAAYASGEEYAVGRGAEARMARVTLVSAGFWRALGTRPALGRLIADDEAHPATGARVVVLGHAFWRRHHGGDTSAVGATLQVKGQPYEIVGVAPRGFRGVELADTDVWLPLFAEEDGTGRAASWHTFAGSSNLSFVTRRRPGITAVAAAAELSAIRVRFDEETTPAEWRARQPRPAMRVLVAPVTGALGHDTRRIPEATVAVWLVGVAGALLAIACANVACLLLLRALRRRREIAVRLALGMSRARLAGLLLVESAALAAAGGLAAALVVVWGGAWVRGALLPGMVGGSAGTDWRVVGVAAACVVSTALLTGLVPVLATRRDLRAGALSGLRDGAQHGATGRSRLYWGLLVAQTALSAVLLVGAGLFVRSLHRVTTRDLGLDTERTLVVRMDFAGSGRKGAERMALYERLLERVRAVPGVQAASLAVGAPLHGARGHGVRVTPGGEWVGEGRGSPLGNYVSDRFFEATGMRIVQGRPIVASDRGGPPVVVVNETLARAGWPGRSPVGECAYLSSAADVCARVVGVVRDAHTFRIREDATRPWVYAALDPADVDDRVLLVRHHPDASGMEGTLRRALREVDPALPYVDVQRLGDALDPQIRPWRLGAAVFTAFGLLAAVLAALGLYTAVAYAVTQRTRELGVRIAVGARARTVVALVLGDGVRVAVVGVALGLLLALAGGRWIADLLFDTSPRDPLVLLGVAGGLLLVAVLASVAPARRAARVSPTEALRAE